MQEIVEINPDYIDKALKRISKYLRNTPILESSLLNSWLGHEVVFKAELFQKTGAFKARGALNALLKLKEEGKLPKKVVAYSSGNHAQGVAWACREMKIPCTIYLPKNVSPIKVRATAAYGAEVVQTSNRIEAERIANEEVAKGAVLLPPFDDDDIIEGQGTCALEVFNEWVKPDAVFVPCGGGGLTAGTFLATKLKSPETKVFAVEPELANDAKRSYESGSIYRFSEAPNTIADGTRTLALSERTFHYLKKIAGVYDVTEDEIIYWSQWINHLLKVTCEPSSAQAMAAG